jgi:pentatricopeptide repeat protein
MPRRRSPYTPEIFKEWESLVAPSQPISLLEKETRAFALEARCVANGKWVVSLDDAQLITLLMVPLDMQAKRWIDAIDRCQRHLTHPHGGDWRTDDIWDQVQAWSGGAMILNGQVEAGIEVLDQMLADGLPPTQYRRILARNLLLGICDDHSARRVADKRIAAYATRAVRGWEDRPDLVAILETAKTWGQLRRGLSATLPSRLTSTSAKPEARKD